MTSMEYLVLIFCFLPAITLSITVSSNGNSPHVKMIGGMMVDVQNGFVPMTPKTITTTEASNYEKSRKSNLNGTKISINERYRRLIPYMTFYYANDLTAPTTESYTKNVEVEKAQIVEAQTMDRQPKKIIHSPYRNIPRYQGNRLTEYNIASANPTRAYKDVIPSPFYGPIRTKTNYHNYHKDYNGENHDFSRVVYKPGNIKLPSSPFAPSTRKPHFNLFQSDDSPNVQYYFPNKEVSPKYKLVPYEQTPPVKVESLHKESYEPQNPVPVPVLLPKEPVYIKPRPRPQYQYEHIFSQQTVPRKPTIVSESYYEKGRPQHEVLLPHIEGGFKPITNSPATSTQIPIYSTPSSLSPIIQTNENHNLEEVEHEYNTVPPNHRPNYYQYTVDQPNYQPESKQITLAALLNSLQLNKSIPKPITRENVGSSIRTLLDVLNALKAVPQQKEVETLVLSTPKPFGPKPEIVKIEPEAPVTATEPTPADVEFHQEPYLAPVEPPSQHLDEYYVQGGGTSQQFPLKIENDDEGGTPGKPGVDYPILTTIPTTSFNCKTQRYKGFFADPETKCQVWHYCDLNGGQASFLCPNGTIFSQAALTCDWWFNVRCASTAQLYVINESLYKYILPHSPKFPEDYSGPLVDKYLTLKFKEMEEQFRKNKNKKTAAEKMDSEEESETSSEGDIEEMKETDEVDDTRQVDDSSVVVESPGSSGNVERLRD